jgi:hypothetical protein
MKTASCRTLACMVEGLHLRVGLQAQNFAIGSDGAPVFTW